MNIKSLLKRIPGLVRLYRLLFRNTRVQESPYRWLYPSYPYDELHDLSSDELLSLIRHEAHRIEKAVYNNLLKKYRSTYQEKRERLSTIYQILKDRDYPADEPTIVWSRQIYDAFDNLETDFIQRDSLPPSDFDSTQAQSFVEFLRERRSVRVWAEKQPNLCVLEEITYSMIDAARWAPTSGNRQPWRFLILKNREEKELLRHIKEDHCVGAPLLIFVGMDTRVYGALGQSERSIFIDAGAAIMQMILVAHKCGLGVCWNHFADDLINSREMNQEIYANFTKKLNIPDYIAPIAIIAVGLPKFIPPAPARMNIETLMINSKQLKGALTENM